MLKFFAEKMWVAFAVQKLLTFFSAKNIRILYIESAKTVNEMTLNELVKLTTLWTTGPRIRRNYAWHNNNKARKILSGSEYLDTLCRFPIILTREITFMTSFLAKVSYTKLLLLLLVVVVVVVIFIENKTTFHVKRLPGRRFTWMSVMI